MVSSPREVVGAVLKYMGASYNTKNIDLQVPGGRNAVEKNLALLVKQVVPEYDALSSPYASPVKERN